MAEKFELEIEKAKRSRSKKTQAIVLCSALFFFTTALVYLYLTAFQINVIQKNYKSPINITTQSGNSVSIGHNRLFLISSQAELQITAEGYKSKTLFLEKSQVSRILDVQLSYAEVPVKITKSEETPSARWMVNNINIASTNNLDITLKPGNYNLRLSSRNYEDYTSKINVMPAKGFNSEISLTPTAIPYDIQTVPTGSEVYFDGKLVGISPVKGTIDSHIVRVVISKSKFVDVIESVDLALQNGKFSRSYNLKSQQGSLQVLYSPKGGRLFVNNVEVAASDRVAVRVASSNNIRYSHPGYDDQSITTEQGVGQIQFRLRPEYGDVYITANVKAKVYQGKKYLGDTPFNQSFLSVRQRFKIIRDEYAPQYFTIDVLKRKEHRIDAELLTWSRHHLNQSKAIMTNSFGMILKRFRGQGFEMGARPYIRGRRANEIIRNVKFRRAFYLSTKEITEADYAQFNSRTKSSLKPVVNISWNEAAIYCNWLSEIEGFQPFYFAKEGKVIGANKISRGYRLPTEAEWEYAARFANKRKPTIFVWGDDYEIDSGAGNIADKSAQDSVRTYIGSYNDSFKLRAPPGSFPIEKSGLYDMSGNVSEWVTDALSYEVPTKNDVYLDYMGPPQGRDHVIKGSNFTSANWTELRASFKESSDIGLPELGFRVARYID